MVFIRHLCNRKDSELILFLSFLDYFFLFKILCFNPSFPKRRNKLLKVLNLIHLIKR